ncbi:MAG: thermonuclease family protein [Myxococcota bacterium]|nr:thermonuclease family protein [Myxococcota bacterium]
MPSRSALLVVLLAASAPAGADPAASLVFINGQPTPVLFNDGDSFRVLDGPHRGMRTRLAGFNALEAHGPVHQWGSWTPEELYVLAKMATLQARRGVWHCTIQDRPDGYGRTLLWCPDLAETQVRSGLAHVLSVTDEPGDPVLLRAQREAMQARRGLWAHGVPPFLLTSLHSREEDTEGRGTFNRLVSTADGHSVPWVHHEQYAECTRICHRQYPSNPETEARLLERLRADPAASPEVRQASVEELRAAIHMYVRYRVLGRPVRQALREPLRQLLERYRDAGALGSDPGQETSCMYHVPFQRRYGPLRAACLIK